ncbi:hypothetical protein K493DRAFT_207680 [Basidiobolus meristosporus CBS 931.73]|uniref:Copper transport protein n=1 Tax=Basidiobolus meristosporus CBS 931.73 TaxID=1314790 RepID=A0A1Y1YXW1_9FUNG|nr:hypothetical protein K493DRAFT_207680 [Basidiobolus meristosporus CBS 931.73]|eukprot:ORY02878.1 hypothetical protein K493DRAFT_207680 [Basidiobolus meristosporus CBS 931.73]
MSLNWEYHNVCVIVANWQIHTVTGLFVACFGAFSLSVMYELMRLVIRLVDLQIGLRRNSVGAAKDTQLFAMTNVSSKLSYGEKLIRSVMYAIQVSLSYCLMLLFMTLNGFLMGSAVLGGFVGFLIFSQDTLL